MTGEQEPYPDIREILAAMQRSINDLASRLNAPGDGLRLGDLIDVSTNGLGDPDINLQNGQAITYRSSDKMFVPKAVAAGAVFSYPGTLVTGVESPPLYEQNDVAYSLIRVSQLAAGGSNLVIDVNVSGSLVHTVTLPSGDATHTVTAATDVPAGEPLTIVVNDAGDAANATIEFF